ncbi:MAG: hypothetical protein KKH40_03035 [Nanoarchaeota archaeon]|nr:hypothetical protein [Nanoarchaeota archaeon]
MAPEQKKITKKPFWRNKNTYILIGATILTLQAENIYRHIKNFIKPNEITQEFKEEFKIPLKGHDYNLKYLPNIRSLAFALKREQIELPYTLKNFRIKPNNFFRQELTEQINTIFGTEYSGYYNPMSKNIAINELVCTSTVHHEIKHAKTFDTLKKHPEFKKQWKEIAKDENGNSPYLNGFFQFCGRVILLNNLVPIDTLSSLDDLKEGFVSDYAKTNFYEDVAELGTEVELGYSIGSITGLDYFICDKSNKNTRIQKKITLLAEHQIIPAEYPEFAKLKEKYFESFGSEFGSTDKEKGEIFLEASKEFIKKHPDTIYKSTIYKARGEINNNLAYYYPNQLERMNLMVQEYKQALKCEYQEFYETSMILDELTNYYYQINDSAKENMCREASINYLTHDLKEAIHITNSTTKLLESRGFFDD